MVANHSNYSKVIRLWYRHALFSSLQQVRKLFEFGLISLCLINEEINKFSSGLNNVALSQFAWTLCYDDYHPEVLWLLVERVQNDDVMLFFGNLFHTDKNKRLR